MLSFALAAVRKFMVTELQWLTLVFWLCYHLVAEGVAGACTYCLMTDNSNTLLAFLTGLGSGLGFVAGLNTDGPGGI